MRFAEVRPMYRVPAEPTDRVPVAYLDRAEAEALKRTATLADTIRGRLIDRYSEFGNSLAAMAALALELAYSPEIALEEDAL